MLPFNLSTDTKLTTNHCHARLQHCKCAATAKASSEHMKMLLSLFKVQSIHLQGTCTDSACSIAGIKASGQESSFRCDCAQSDCMLHIKHSSSRAHLACAQYVLILICCRCASICGGVPKAPACYPGRLTFLLGKRDLQASHAHHLKRRRTTLVPCAILLATRSCCSAAGWVVRPGSGSLRAACRSKSGASKSRHAAEAHLHNDFVALCAERLDLFSHVVCKLLRVL